jgi:hypothetical protein
MAGGARRAGARTRPVVADGVRISVLLDAAGDLGELDELFPRTSDWDGYRAAYPPLFSGSRFRLLCVSFRSEARERPSWSTPASDRLAFGKTGITTSRGSSPWL